MQFSPPFIRRLHGVRYYIGIGAIGGLVLGAGIELTLSSGQPYNVVLSSLRGMLTGAMVAGLISAFEFFFAQSPQGRGFRRLSFGTMILWRVVYYSSVVLLCDFVGSHFSTRPWGFNRPTMIVFAVALAFSSRLGA